MINLSKLVLINFILLVFLALPAYGDDSQVPLPTQTTKQSKTTQTNSSSIKTEVKALTSNYPDLNWSLTSLKGEPISIKDYQGKPVLLMFWATWCPYCKKVFPGVNRVYEKYKKQGFTLIAMNIREDGDPKLYMQERGYQFEVALDADEVAAKYGVSGTPTMIFIDKSGVILGKVTISDPKHPIFESFAKEQLGLLKVPES